jgi:hypothetical protein
VPLTTTENAPSERTPLANARGYAPLARALATTNRVAIALPRAAGVPLNFDTLCIMNSRYFACPKCKTYTSAGYRWAYWLLEHKGLVEPNRSVDVVAIQAAEDYWNPPCEPQSDWLYKQILPTVRAFLSEHAAHDILYVESGEFFGRDDFESWLEIGSD